MAKSPKIIETIKVLATYKKYATQNNGDDSTIDLLTGMTCDILDISPDKLLELCEENKEIIDIVNAEEK